MGMRSGLYGGASGVGGGSSVRSAGAGNAGYSSGGTSSYPVTGFPASAYLGNNRRVAGGYQSSPSAISSALGNVTQFSSQHIIIVLAVIAVVGYTLWHLDNKR
jgi:hypothetical protein